MDEYSSRRAVSGVGFSRGSSSHAFRDNNEDRSIQYCNRLGCSTRQSVMRAAQVANSEKLKSSRPAFLSTHNKAADGKSSKTLTALNAHKRPQWDRGNTSSLQERVIVESGARQEHIEDVSSSVREEELITLEVDPIRAGMRRVLPEPKDLESSFVKEFSIKRAVASTRCQVVSNSRTWKPSSQKTGSHNQDVSSSSSVQHSVIPNNVNGMVKHSLNQGASMQRRRLKNLSCTSISDVLPSGCSSSDVGHNKRTGVLKKRYPDGQSSSSRGKGTGESLSGGNTDPLGSGSSGPHFSSLERPSPQPARRTGNLLTSRDDVVSVRTQRSDSSNKSRIPENVDANAFSLPELAIPQSSQAQFYLCEASAASLSESFPADLPPFRQNSSGRSSCSSRTAYPRPMDHSEDSSFRSFCDPWVCRDGYRYLSMEGIAQVLLALERIEQDEEMTYEQLMILESNLISGGTGLYDQHRDMRLDIDNMSYEELLALEEKMGTVSTALTEEALSKCLKKSIYTARLGSQITRADDDIKCSICQEECIVGDEIGKLHCDHRYHLTCIHQWLRQKNWCPICKSLACPS